MQDARSGTTLGYGLWLKKFMDGTCVWFFYCQIREMFLRLCRRCMCGQCSKSQAKKVCQTRLVGRPGGHADPADPMAAI